MQYHLNILSKKDKEGFKLVNIKEDIILILVLFLAGVLISRVIIYLNAEVFEGMAPFGVAYTMAIIMTRNIKKIVSAVIGVIVGYFTVINNIQNPYINIFIISLLLFYSLIINRIHRRVGELTSFLIVFLSYSIYGYLVNNYSLKVDIIQSIINTLIVISVYFIVRYASECMKEINENYMFSSEEIISIGILVCIAISGFGNLAFFHISLRTVFAYFIILVFAHSGGAIYGATIGTVMGLIIGICSNDLMNNIGLFSLIGIVAGVFKGLGKILISTVFFLTYLSINLYSRGFERYSIIGFAIAIVIFFLLPRRLLEAIETEINMEKKRVKLSQFELNELKDEFTQKVKALGISLMTVSNMLATIGGSRGIENKMMSESVIGNLADRVCSKCTKAKQCWEKDFNITYNSFEEIIDNSENRKDVFPNHLEKICLKKLHLMRNADSLVNSFKGDLKKKEMLGEGRIIISKHVKKIALSIDSMLNDFKRDVILCGELERVIRKGLNRNLIKYKSIFCYRDINARAKVKITFDKEIKDKLLDKDILLIINGLINTPMIISEEESRYEVQNGEYILVLNETPKFQVVSYGAISAKDGEEYIGDTYSFGRTKEGNYMTVISDGMGTGPQASRESGMAVEIVESFFEAGFDSNIAINMVNALMGMELEEEEQFSTLDLNVINLYSGEIDFIKVGAVPSFIKRGKSIKIIMSNMPPFGLTDELEIEPYKTNVKGGDIIVTVSDGILDVTSRLYENSSWIEEYLINAVREPKQLAEDILQKAKELCGGISKDDMTVVVSKVSSMY